MKNIIDFGNFKEKTEYDKDKDKNRFSHLEYILKGTSGSGKTQYMNFMPTLKGTGNYPHPKEKD